MAELSPFKRVKAAPVMGVGLGIDIFDSQPDFRVLIDKHRGGFDFLEVYSRGDWEHTDDPFAEIPADVPRTYHHEGLDPGFWCRMKAEYTDREIVELTMCLGAWLAFGRLNHVLGLDAECVLPEGLESGLGTPLPGETRPRSGEVVSG